MPSLPSTPTQRRTFCGARSCAMVAKSSIANAASMPSPSYGIVRPWVLECSKTSVLIRRSKIEQFGQGRCLVLSDRATISLKEWLIRKRNPKNGHVFLGVDRAQKITYSIYAAQINGIYKPLAERADLSKNMIDQISGHSLRVGHAQNMVNSGESLPMIMSKGRWSKIGTVMRYVEHISYPWGKLIKFWTHP